MALLLPASDRSGIIAVPSNARTSQLQFLVYLINLQSAVYTRYQAEPGNADPEEEPPIFPFSREAEPLDIGERAEPRNQLTLLF